MSYSVQGVTATGCVRVCACVYAERARQSAALQVFNDLKETHFTSKELLLARNAVWRQSSSW